MAAAREIGEGGKHILAVLLHEPVRKAASAFEADEEALADGGKVLEID